MGLGRFGSALALELMAGGTEVLGIDADPDIVQALNGRLSQVVRTDSTKEEALRQLAVADFEYAVVGIGTHIESSILTASLLVSFGIKQVWAKALSEAHGRILTQLGVAHVVFPEADMGRRVAHLVRGAVLDYIQFEDDFAMVKTCPPAEMIGKRLGDTGIRSRHDVTVVAVHRRGEGFTYATADTVVHPEDMIIVAGRTQAAERFSHLG
ncbi:TrkA family potassium uptake protein [Modestobacter lapidis]|nr:TrkA family potassium uptake protein [Modestobacter lapidis]